MASSINALINPINDIATISYDTAFDEARALWVGTSGDVEVITRAGTTVVLPSVAAGMWHGLRFTEIVSTNTTVAAASIRVGY